MSFPKKIFEKSILSNDYVKILQKDFVDENGKTSSFLIHSNNREKSIGTFVLPITEDEKIIYLKEFRPGPEEWIISFPVGMLEDSVTEAENCQKELREETGYYSDEIMFLGESIVENYVAGKSRFYIAKNCRKIAEQNLENGENILVYSATKEEFLEMILDGKVNCAKAGFMFFLALQKGFL